MFGSEGGSLQQKVFRFLRGKEERKFKGAFYLEKMEGYECNYFDTRNEPFHLCIHIKYPDLIDMIFEIIFKIIYAIFKKKKSLIFMSNRQEKENLVSFIFGMSKTDTIIDTTNGSEFCYKLVTSPVSHGSGIFGKSLELKVVPQKQCQELDLEKIEGLLEEILDGISANGSIAQKDDITYYIKIIKEEVQKPVPEKIIINGALEALKKLKGSIEFSSAIVTLAQFFKSLWN